MVFPPNPLLASLTCFQPVGTKGRFKDLPGGNIEDHCVGFFMLNVLSRPAQRLAGIGTSTLVFVCTLWHKEVFNTGTYIPTT